MSTIANLNVSVTAGVEDFKKGMSEVNLHSLHSRHALQSLALAAGEPAAPLMHIVHALTAFPGPIGAAVAAVLVFREAMHSNAEATKKANDEAREFARIQKEIAAGLNVGENWGENARMIEAQLDKVDKALEALEKKYAKGGNVAVLRREGEQLGLNKLHLEQVLKAYKELDDELADIKDRKYEMAILNDPNDNARNLIDTLSILDDELEIYQDALERAPNTEAANKMRDAFRKTYLEIIHLREEYFKLTHEVTAEPKPLVDKEAIKQFRELETFAQHVFDQTRLPEEKLKEQIAHLEEAWQEGMLDTDTLTRAIAKAQDDFEKAQGKNVAPREHHLSLARAVGVQDAYVEGLKNRSDDGTKQMVNEQKQTNTHLRTLVTRASQGAPATCQ